MSDIVERLMDACNGHPHAKIPWPHRVLHEAADEIASLRSRLERAREGVAELNRFAKERKFDTGYLASNPPQNPVAYELGWRTKELLRELENEGGSDAPAECPRCGEAMTNNTCRHCGLNF